MKSGQSSPTNLPRRIANQLRDRIFAENKPGDRLPTVAELAKQLGVSKHSVGNALELLSREQVIEKRQRSGVRVSLNRRWRIGVYSEMDLLHPRTGHFFRGLAAALLAYLRQIGTEPVLYTGSFMAKDSNPDEPTCPQFWADATAGRVDGAVITNCPHTPAWINRHLQCPIPLVGDLATGFRVPIGTSSVIAAAVRTLTAQGCRRIGLIHWGGPEDTVIFRACATAAGAVTDDAWIRSGMDPQLPGAGWDEFREIWLLSRTKPDGLIILDDMLFFDAQSAMLQLDVRVPEDLRLVVQTNRGASGSIHLPVNTIEIDPADAAAPLVDMLLKRLRGESIPASTQSLAFHQGVAGPHVANSERLHESSATSSCHPDGFERT